MPKQNFKIYNLEVKVSQLVGLPEIFHYYRASSISAQKYREIINQAIKQSAIDLTIPQISILFALRDFAEVGAGPYLIADWIGVNYSGVARELTGLEFEGLITRKQNPMDSRNSLAILTSLGQQKIDQVKTAFEGVNCNG